VSDPFTRREDRRRRAGTRRSPEEGAPVGRRVVLGMLGLGAAGIVFGAGAEGKLGGVLDDLVPGAGEFRLYTITGSYPDIPNQDYKLSVTGMVDKPLELTLDDLEAMPATNLVRTFHCVTGWTVPQVHWRGVHLADVLAAAGLRPGATALRFFSYDGAYTESLTLAQARLPDVVVAYRMLGAPITPEHGGPVRMYVAPMYGYKSIKWLKGIEVTNEVVPGFWEDEGYAVDGWIGGVPETGGSSS
jgi:DMSO/TMAO reductase YedYZ molybdopterin-dependent catalytic subunit